jgi:hypothetical protein
MTNEPAPRDGETVAAGARGGYADDWVSLGVWL